MNYRALKREEAKRLKNRIEETQSFSKYNVRNLGGGVFVEFDINDIHYQFPVGIEFLRKSESRRTKEFDKFVADCIVHAVQLTAIRLSAVKE